jgi:hypothetical protein
MSTSASKAVWASDLQPLGKRMVALVLAWHCNETTGEAWPSIATIAREAGMAHESVRHTLRALRADGVIEAVTPMTGGSPSSTTRYRFKAEWLRGVSTNPGAYKPGSGEYSDPGLTSTEPRSGETAERNEREPKAPLSLKATRRSASAPRKARASSAAETGFDQKDYSVGVGHV